MKSWICVLLCALMLGLCACGTGGTPAVTSEPAESATETPEEPAEEKPQGLSVLPGAALHEATAVEETGGKSDALEQAQVFVDEAVEKLIAVFGEPLSRDYAPSCLGPGEDGELQYEDFTVYTYKNAGQETITGVE